MSSEVFKRKKDDLFPPWQVILLLAGDVKEIVTPSGEKAYEAWTGGGLIGTPDMTLDRNKGVLNHTLLVRRVALSLARMLNFVHQNDSDWQEISVSEVSTNAFMEDFAKRVEVEDKNKAKLQSDHLTRDHVEAGVEILNHAALISQDLRSTLIRALQTHLYGMNRYTNEESKPKEWSEKILLLADHYATGKIVSLEERFSDFIQRQKKGETMDTDVEEYERIMNYCYQLENELLENLGMTKRAFSTWLQNIPPTHDEYVMRQLFSKEWTAIVDILEFFKKSSFIS